jgi:Zn ribbon nucleic-acid-binding protein
MALLTTTENKELEDARKQVVATDRVCPACKAPFTSSGTTLSVWNAPLGIEGHKCPKCGAVMQVMR